MEASFYNFYLDLFKKKGYGVVYNTHSGTIVAIHHLNTWQALTTNDEKSLCNEDMADLINNKMWVNSFDEEFSDIKKKYEKRVHASNTLYLTMLPTEACNFACPYCFLWEKAPRTMNAQLYNDVLSYVDNYVNEKTNISYIMLNWFGGEPTLCHKQIHEFMTKLSEFANQRNIKIGSSITTNGYLLNKEILRKLLIAGIKNFQVTVDGTRDAHNQGRPLKSGEGTYDVIMKNLTEIHSLDSTFEFQMDIRCNFTRRTIKAVDDYIDIFMQQFGADKRFKLYCRPVYEYETKDNDISKMADDILSLEEGLLYQNRFAEKIDSLRTDSIKRRMVDPLPQPTPCWCNAEIENHIIIGSDGSIYICDTLTGHNHAIGSLKDGKIVINDSKNFRYNIFNDARTEKCMHCKLLPICMGGCLINRLECAAQCYWTADGIQNALMKQYG